MPNKICLSFQHPSVLTDDEQAAMVTLKKAVFSQLRDAGHEPFEAVLRPLNHRSFLSEPSARMHALIIIHQGSRGAVVHFDLANARLPVGYPPGPILVVLIEFEGVDYSGFTVSTNNVDLRRIAVKSGANLSLIELLPDLFQEEVRV